MSGWTVESDDLVAYDPPKQRNNDSTRSKTTRRAFFADNDSREEGVQADKRRHSLTLISTASVSRRSHRGSHKELVVDDSDEGSSPYENERAVETTKSAPLHKHQDDSRGCMVEPTGKTVAATRQGKSDEITAPEIVQRSSAAAIDTHATAMAHSKAEDPTSLYVRWLVRDFLQKRYPRELLATFDKEHHPPSDDKQLEEVHQRLVGQDAIQCGNTRLEQTLATWDTRIHRRELVKPRSRRHEQVSLAPDAATAPPTQSSSKAKSKSSSSSSRKKPLLSVTVNTDDDSPEPLATSHNDEGFNCLNHPGHTPKAHASTVLEAVIGKPGSTPRTSASELKALGFEDVDDDEGHSTGSLLRVQHVEEMAPGDDNDDDDLSMYAKRKRAACRHAKHVYIGEPGRTPTKEYVFFRETPPQFVTETVQAAEDVVRSLGGDPRVNRQQTHQAAAQLERFVELQSSDVAKYTVGLRVENLGAQRNVSGTVSKLYGSRQCGMAGSGTIIIDTWNGSETAPTDEMQLNEDDEELIAQLTE